MRLVVRNEKLAASKYVAQYIIDRINTFAPTESKPFVLGLPTGRSPLLIYKSLVERHRVGDISFKNVVTFNMDEYIGLDREHPESYHSFMFQNFFSHVDVPPSQINILNGNAPDLEAECMAYEAKIKAVGGIELFLGGIGADGHIAFNEPGSSLVFGGDMHMVPKMALTVGIQTILEAREVMIVVTGAHKALALQRCIEGGVNHIWTLSALQMHPHSLVVCDEDATLDLQVKTVKYFKSIDEVEKEFGIRQANSISVQLGTPVISDGKLRLDTEVEEQQVFARKELAAIAESIALVPPIKPLSGAVTPELSPKNMASRIQISPSPDPTPEDLLFDRMESRIGPNSIAV